VLHGIARFSNIEGKMACDVKMQLAPEYDAATALFSEAVAELRRNIGTSTKQRYEQLGRFAKDPRAKSEQARLALEQHSADHPC
jgi:hypothetical protein